MSLVAASFPPSNIVAGSYAIDQTPAYLSTNVIDYTFVQADVNLVQPSGTLIALYTTEASKGRFVPAAINIIMQNSYSGGVAPVITVGAIASTYNDIVVATTLTNVSTANGYGSGQFETPVTTLSLKGSPIISVAPSTTIYLRISSSSTATSDRRSVALLGFYVG